MPQRIPLDRWLSRTRWRSRLAAGLLAMGFAALLVWRVSDAGGVPADRLAARLVGVESPNVVRLTHGGRSVTLRLAGVLVEEGCRDDAVREIAEVCAKDDLLVTYDERSPGRDAGYVYLPDGRMVNEWLISRGLVRAEDGEYALSEWFAKLEGVAKRRKTGMWGTVPPVATHER